MMLNLKEAHVQFATDAHRIRKERDDRCMVFFFQYLEKKMCENNLDGSQSTNAAFQETRERSTGS